MWTQVYVYLYLLGLVATAMKYSAWLVLFFVLMTIASLICQGHWFFAGVISGVYRGCISGHLSPNFWGIWKISSCFRKFGQFGNLFCPVISSSLQGEKTFFCHCPPSQVLSHMKVSMLGRPTLGQMPRHP
jgi:hypothetical protein